MRDFFFYNIDGWSQIHSIFVILILSVMSDDNMRENDESKPSISFIEQFIAEDLKE